MVASVWVRGMGAIERAQTRGLCEGTGSSDPHLPPLFALRALSSYLALQASKNPFLISSAYEAGYYPNRLISL